MQVTVQDLTDALRAGIQYRLSNNSIIEKKYFLRSWLHSCGFYLFTQKNQPPTTFIIGNRRERISPYLLKKYGDILDINIAI